MTVHLVKLCVGCDSIEDLASWQAERLKQMKAEKKKPELFHRTFQPASTGKVRFWPYATSATPRRASPMAGAIPLAGNELARTSSTETPSRLATTARLSGGTESPSPPIIRVASPYATRLQSGEGATSHTLSSLTQAPVRSDASMNPSKKASASTETQSSMASSALLSGE